MGGFKGFGGVWEFEVEVLWVVGLRSFKYFQVGYCPHPVTVYIRGPIKGDIYPYCDYYPTATEGGVAVPEFQASGFGGRGLYVLRGHWSRDLRGGSLREIEWSYEPIGGLPQIGVLSREIPNKGSFELILRSPSVETSM